MVFDKVKAILAQQFDMDEDDILMDSSIVDDFNADSIDFVDLIMSVEEEFDIEVPDENLENIKTVGDMVKYIEEQIK